MAISSSISSFKVNTLWYLIFHHFQRYIIRYLSLLLSSEYNFSFFNCSGYVRCSISLILLINLLCTISRSTISCFLVGFHIWQPYSTFCLMRDVNSFHWYYLPSLEYSEDPFTDISGFHHHISDVESKCTIPTHIYS